MDYQLLNARTEDKEIIYQIKKDSIKKYVEEIWGWNEEFQKKSLIMTFSFKIIK